VPFAIGVHEVTFEEWDACVDEGGCDGYRPPDWGWGRGRRPVTEVSWQDAREYVEWLSEETGHPYGLPSGTTYPACSDGQGEGTAPVGSYEPNAFGLHDMIGNLTEWTDDCWNPDHSGRPENAGTRFSGDCSWRILRGGTWGYPSEYLRSAHRFQFELDHRDNGLGFRVVRFNR